MLDVQKAFDSIDHIQLIEKIKLAGLDPVWFASYFQNRKQTVFVNGFPSGEEQIKAGVPQGSILGPWFYLLYCNDMPSCIASSKTNMLLYADDTILISSHKDVTVFQRNKKMHLQNVTTGSQTIGLLCIVVRLNPSCLHLRGKSISQKTSL